MVRRKYHLSVFVALICTTYPASAQSSGDPFATVAEQRRHDATELAEPQQANAGSQNQLAPVIIADIDRIPATPDPSSGNAVIIGAVDVQSSALLSPILLAGSYERFIGEAATGERLTALASSVAGAARAEGYIFASVEVPRQSVKVGVVTVRLDLGAIDEVRIIGSSNRRLRQILEALVGPATQAAILEQQLLLAADLPGISVTKTDYGRDTGKGVLTVTVRETRSQGYVSIDNYGPDTLGPTRVQTQLRYSSLLLDDDSVSMTMISTAAQPSELAFVNVRYARTLGDGNHVLGIAGSAGRTRSGGPQRPSDYRGRNRYAAIFYSKSLRRSRDFNLWLNGELAYLDVQQTQAGTMFQNDEIATATVNFVANQRVGSGRIYGGFGVTRGLGILGASEAGDPLNSRANADGTFTTANVWVNAILDFGGGFGARVAGNGQISSEPLLSPYELAVGGPYFGRGYDFSEKFGDEGVTGLVELRKEFRHLSRALDWLQFYGFADGGIVNEIGLGLGDGSLLSAGGGVRASVGSLNLDLQAAAPINKIRFESQNRSPKVTFQVGANF